MIFSILLSFAILSLILDLYILKRNIPKIKWIRILYITQTLLLDIGIISWMLFSLFLKPTLSDDASVVLMWIMLIFIITFFLKSFYGSFSALEWLLNKITSRRYRFLLYVGGALCVPLICVVVYGTTIGRSSIRIEEVTIESPSIPLSFDGFTIAQFSDTHLGNLGTKTSLIKNMVQKINDLHPDIIVNSGDLVNIHSGELNEEFTRQLSALHAPVYSVLGNHDLAYYIRNKALSPETSIYELIQKQRNMGWHLLLNENRWIHRGEDSIAIAGVIYPKDKRFGVRNNNFISGDLRKSFDGVSSDNFSVLISHSPAALDSIPRVISPDLILSGHVHAMQTKITIGDWKWSPASLLFPIWSGLWSNGENTLYINDGMGYSLYPMRIGVRPEITFITLKSQKKQ